MTHRGFWLIAVSLFVVVAAGCSPGEMRVELTGHSRPVSKVAISPDGTTVATGGEDGTVRLWDAVDGRERRSLARSVTDLAFSPDGRYLATASTQSVVLWDPETGEEKRRLRLESEEEDSAGSKSGRNRKETRASWKIRCIAFSPDGKKLAAGGGGVSTGFVPKGASGRPSGRHPSTYGVAIWDLTDGDATPQRFLGLGATCLAFSADGQILAVGSGTMKSAMFGSSGFLSLFDADTGKKVADCEFADSTHYAHKEGVTSCLAFSPDGSVLASGSEDKEPLVEGAAGMNANRADVALWEVASGKQLASFDGGMKQYKSLAFTPDGNTLVVAGGNPFPTFESGAVKMFDSKSGKERTTLVRFDYQVESTALSSDGKTLVLASNDRTSGTKKRVMRRIKHANQGVGAKREDAEDSPETQTVFVQVWSLN